MTIETINGTIVVTEKEDIELARLMTLKVALGLEVKGMSLSRGRQSAYILIKEEFKLSGTKASVLAQFIVILEKLKKKRLAKNQ